MEATKRPSLNGQASAAAIAVFGPIGAGRRRDRGHRLRVRGRRVADSNCGREIGREDLADRDRQRPPAHRKSLVQDRCELDVDRVVDAGSTYPGFSATLSEHGWYGNAPVLLSQL